MSENSDLLKSYIENTSSHDKALKMIKCPYNEHEAEAFVFAVLWSEKSTPELIDAAFQGCIDLHEQMNYRSGHGTWVHSMSHFMEALWERRLTDWIKRFHEVSFRGAIELGNTSCSDRLVKYFADNARFDDDPADFHLTPDELKWLDWEKTLNESYAQKRLEHGVFDSENELKIFRLRWELLNHSFFNGEGEVKVPAITAKIEELRELGGDTSEFDGIVRQKLEQGIENLRSAISRVQGFDSRHWSDQDKEERIAELQQAINRSLAQLAQL